MELHGVIPYLVSPIRPSGEVDRPVLTDLVDHLIARGVHGLTPLGSTGEFAYLSNEQRHQVVEAVMAANHGRVPVVAGVAATTIADAVAQTERLVSLGVDGVLAILEAYFPVSDDGVELYFREIAKAARGRPVVLYTNPQFQRSDLSLAVLERLSRVENIGYVKDASNNTGRLLSILNRTEGRLKIMSASSHIPACVMLIGGTGWMAGPACVIPEQSVALYEAARAGDFARAMEIQRPLWGINEVFAKFNIAACIKAALELQGFAVGKPLGPDGSLSEAAILEIKAALEKVEFKREILS